MLYKKEQEKINQILFRVGKVIKKKCIKFSLKKKGYYNSFNSWIGKKRYCYNMNYFPELYSHSKNKIKIEVNLFVD